MQDEKYIKASDRIIDENIKVSLELKIRQLVSSQKELENALTTAIKSEDETHGNLITLQEKITKLNGLIETLKEKLASINDDDESSGYYKALIAEQEKKRNKTEVEAKITEEEYRRAVETLTDLTTKVSLGKEKIETEKAKLKETENNLASNASYIDTKLKKEDEKRLEELEEKLESLEKRKEEIQNDAVMIGNEAKELLIEDDRMGCFLKIKELVNLLKKNPYMDIASSQELAHVLQESEERAIRERDEFAALLENKRYDGNDTQIILEREKYLEQQKIDLENDLASCQLKIKNIDMNKVKAINTLLSSANIIAENLRKELAENKQVMNSNLENATPRKKAILNAAYNKKEEEFKIIQKIIESYEEEMQELIKESKRIAETEMKAIKDKMNKIAEDLKDIHKKTMISSKTKDVLAVENDKTKLKELNDQVKEINMLKKFSQTPSEIYDEVEMMLGSFISNDKEEKEEVKPIIEETESDLINNFRISESNNDKTSFNRSEKNKDVLNENVILNTIEEQPKLDEMDMQENLVVESNSLNSSVLANDDFVEKSKDVETEKTVDSTNNLETEIPVQPTFVVDSFITTPNHNDSFIEMTTSNQLDNPANIETMNLDEIMPIGTLNEPPKERWKVIHVESLQDSTAEASPITNNTDDVMISDFKDEDYIDFNTLLDGGKV